MRKQKYCRSLLTILAAIACSGLVGLGKVLPVASAQGNSLVYVPADSPCRVLRTQGTGQTHLIAGAPREFSSFGSAGTIGAQGGNGAGCDHPRSSEGIQPTAIAANVTAVGKQATGNGNIVAYPAGGAVPSASTLNYTTTANIANSTLITLRTSDGKFNLLSSFSHVPAIVDVLGYFYPIGGEQQVTVNCPAESIQDAVNSAPTDGPLVVTISGICTESVEFTRSDVTFTAATPPATAVTAGGVPTDGIRGDTDGSAAIHVRGGRAILVENIVLESVAGGSVRHGLLVTENGAARTDNVLMRNNFAGAVADFEGFVNITNSKMIDNTNYGIELFNGGSANMDDSIIMHSVSLTANDEAAIGMFRGVKMRFGGNNMVINAGDDGVFDANNIDSAANDDNGISLWPFHVVSVRQQASGHTVFVGNIEAGNNVIMSLRDPQVVGNIELYNSTIMDLRTSSTGEKELSARSVHVNNESHLVFGRADLELEVTGLVEVHNNSELGLFNDSITADFGSINAFRNGSVSLNGTVTVSGDVEINEGSRISKFRQPNTLTMANLRLSNGSQASFRGDVDVTGNMNGYGNTTFDIFDEATNTIDKTVVTVGGNVDIGENSRLGINETARLEATGDINFFGGAAVIVSGCGDGSSPCTAANFSELRANGVNGINFGQHSSLGIFNGGVVTAQNMNAGSFVTLNFDDSELAIGTPVGNVITPGNIGIFNHNQVFWNNNAIVTGNLNAGAYTLINVGGAGSQHQGNMSMNAGIAPGVLNFFSDFTIDGNIDCGGVVLDTPDSTVNTNGNTITFTSGTFTNCP